jgi:type IV pilus assembly protein PilA
MVQRRSGRGGFTLVELSTVVVIVGVLSAYGVPRFLKSVERAKAGEAFAYLASLRAAQERYCSLEGRYATSVTDLDLSVQDPKYFAAPSTFDAGNTGSLESSWTLTLTRKGPSAGYGAYTVTFTQDGLDTSPQNSSIVSKPEINPMASSIAGDGGN